MIDLQRVLLLPSAKVIKVAIGYIDGAYPWCFGGTRPREVEMSEEKYNWVSTVVEEYDQVMIYLKSLYRAEEVE